MGVGVRVWREKRESIEFIMKTVCDKLPVPFPCCCTHTHTHTHTRTHNSPSRSRSHSLSFSIFLSRPQSLLPKLMRRLLLLLAEVFGGECRTRLLYHTY
jgi:hypothetical protein